LASDKAKNNNGIFVIHPDKILERVGDIPIEDVCGIGRKISEHMKFSGIFTIILNTISGVQDISKDFYNAAKSMGANTLNIIKDIVIPGSLPGVLTGVRLAIGLGWMSVI